MADTPATALDAVPYLVAAALWTVSCRAGLPLLAAWWFDRRGPGPLAGPGPVRSGRWRLDAPRAPGRRARGGVRRG